MKKCFFWGATGQAKVLNEFIKSNGFELSCLFDNSKDVSGKIGEAKILGDWKEFEKWSKQNKSKEIKFCVAVGGSFLGEERYNLQKKISEKGFEPLILVHPRAYVCPNVKIGQGCQILAMSFVGVDSKLGDAVIINTGAQVDHECEIGDGVHIMPGAILSGCVVVEPFATIGAGAIVLPRIRIGRGAVVGAGSVVTKNVDPYTVVVGNPAKIIRKLK